MSTDQFANTFLTNRSWYVQTSLHWFGNFNFYFGKFSNFPEILNLTEKMKQWSLYERNSSATIINDSKYVSMVRTLVRWQNYKNTVFAAREDKKEATKKRARIKQCYCCCLYCLLCQIVTYLAGVYLWCPIFKHASFFYCADVLLIRFKHEKK